MSIIELQDVSKLYGFGDATTVALDEVSLRVSKGEFMAIMGPSGCGKSTLLHVIGLLDQPTHGSYHLSGQPVDGLGFNQKSRFRRERIGFVFQFFNLLPKLSVLENVALPLAYQGISRTKRLKQASAVLERVGLAEREYYFPHQLSGGQAQRVAIARALVSNPGIIIADEPTGNLDSGSSRLVMELLSDIHKTGHTVIMVTHNPGLTRYAERVVYMHDGRIIQDEQTAVGEIPEMLQRRMYIVQHKTEEDDLAGVSSVMKAIPQKGGKRAKTPKRKKLRIKTPRATVPRHKTKAPK